MSSDNQISTEPHPLESTDDMETLENSSLSSTYMTSFTTPADTDPLLSPPPPDSPYSTPDPPPSYNDVVFGGPLHEETPSEVQHNGVIKSPDNDNEYLKISVSDPQKEAEQSNSIVPGGNTFVTYLITTRTNFPGFDGSGFVVRRRFRDVVMLSERLSESYRGYFVPPRPDKSVVESQVMQKQEFVEQRRLNLEKYLRRLAAHPVIRKSDELRSFLQGSGDVASGVGDLRRQLSWESGNGMEAAKGGRDLMRMFKELKQSVSNDWGGGRPPVEEEDKEFLVKKERLKNLEQQISATSQQAESLVKSQQHMAETMGDLGLALIKLTKFENANSVFDTQRIRSADMKNAATAAVKGSRLYRELNAQTVKHLDTLHEYLGLMLAVDAAFSDRSSALLTIQALISDLSAMHSKAGKLETASFTIFGNDKSKVDKQEELKDRMRVTENAKSSAIKEYEKIKENNRIEIERFDRERKDDFVNMLKGFVINQVAYTEKVATEWAKVAENTSLYVRE